MTLNFWQGQRVRLRAVEPDDWTHFWAWNQDTLFERATDAVSFPQSQEALRKWVAEQATQEPKRNEFRWVIEDGAGAVVGTLNTHTCDPRHGTFQYGIAIGREFWRRGYALDAIRIVLRYFFHELRYQKCNVHIYSFNEGSVALHRSLGFQDEGRLRRMGYTEGRYYDWILMGLTREEWESGKRGAS